MKPKESKAPYVKEPPKSCSAFFAFKNIVFPLWFLLVPIGCLIWFVTLPYTLWKRISGTSKRITIPIDVKVIEAVVEAHGTRKDTILFVHGWPDCGTLWNSQVSAFSQAGYRCIVVTLPNFGKEEGGGWGYNFPEVAEMLADVIERKNGKEKTTLMLHDWGCTYGYYLQHTRPELVSRIIALDVGGSIRMDKGMLIFVIAYQLFNVFCFLLGGIGGNFLIRTFLKMAKYKARNMNEINTSMNYPYYYIFKNALTGKNLEPIYKYKPDLNECPIWYGYGTKGTKKIGLFHSNNWIAKLQHAERCHVEIFKCDHWITVHKSEQVNTAVLKWLAETSQLPTEGADY